MKILITGTAGFIGAHLVKRLVADNYEIVGLDNINDYYDVEVKYGRLAWTGISREAIEAGKLSSSSIHDNYRFIKLDLVDRMVLEKLFATEQFDTVINLAAQAGVRYSLVNPQAYVDSNIIGFTNLLECSRHNSVKHLVYASSSSVYGLNEKMPLSTRDNVDHPISLYAASKKSNELMAHTYSHLFGLATTGLRFFTVYGPWGRPDMAPFLFTKAMLNGEPIKVFNHGDMIRDFTYIDDIVEGVVRVVQHPPKGDQTWIGTQPDPSSSRAPYKIYNIGNSDPVKLLDFIKAIEDKLKIEAEKIMMDIQPGDVTATYADVQDLMNDLGYKPKTSISEGVSAFIDWYKDFHSVSNE